MVSHEKRYQMGNATYRNAIELSKQAVADLVTPLYGFRETNFFLQNILPESFLFCYVSITLRMVLFGKKMTTIIAESVSIQVVRTPILSASIMSV